MFQHYISALQNYAVFSGRASRSEYWYFVLFNIIISVVLGMIEVTLGLGDEDGGLLTGIYSLVLLVPSVAVAVRRIHDSDKSGWWILLPFYNLYLLIRKGTVGPNRFGEDRVNLDAVSPIPQAATTTEAATMTPETSEESALSAETSESENTNN